MKKVTQLIVSLNIEGEKMEVGELVTDDRTIFFKYYQEFIKTGLQLSPFKLPPQRTNIY